MIFLIDFLTVLIPAIITVLLYFAYYKIFVIGYIKKITAAIECGDYDTAQKLKQNALKRQPQRMKRLFQKYGIG